MPSQRYLFVAGGIGITPLLPMLHQADLVGAEWELLYGGRSRASMAFLDELAAYGDRVRIVPQDECGLLPLAAFLGEPRPDTARLLLRTRPAARRDRGGVRALAARTAAHRAVRRPRSRPPRCATGPFDVELRPHRRAR